jgi:hypothetical protein
MEKIGEVKAVKWTDSGADSEPILMSILEPILDMNRHQNRSDPE